MRLLLLAALALASCGEDEAETSSRRRATTVSDYCSSVQAWQIDWATSEFALLDLVNDARAQARSCGGVSFGPAPALRWDERLRCAGRVHATDMAVRGYFDHTSPEGEQPWDRMSAAGYDWREAGENIAWGYDTPQAVMQGWLDSPGHCENIMNPGFENLGAGYHGDGPQWVQVFGAPAN